MMTERTSRPQRARVAAPRGGRFHPVHVAMGAFGEEASQPRQRLRDRVRPRHADGIEAVLRARVPRAPP